MANINLFDRVLKILARHYAQAFLRLAFPNQELQLVGTLENVELTLPDRRTDFLHRVKAGDAEYLLHFEFQFQHKTEYPQNVFTYSAELTDQHKKPVISIVLYLERRESEIPNEYTVEIGEVVIHRFTYPVLKLWDYEEQIRSGELSDLAPLLILIAEEKSEAVLHRERELILQEQDPQKRADSLATAVMIASRYFDLDKLWQLFTEEVEQMRQSGFITDWIEQGIADGREQGLQQGKRSLLIEQLLAKFGELPQSVHEQIQGITEMAELDALGVRLLTADSLEALGLNGATDRS